LDTGFFRFFLSSAWDSERSEESHWSLRSTYLTQVALNFWKLSDSGYSGLTE